MQRRNPLLRRVPHRLVRHVFNFWPAMRGTGLWVEYVARDWSEIRVRLPLSWRTRNYVGTIFGGSMYGAVDPFLMIMLMQRLGPGYVVWDKAAAIRFKRPAKTTLRATFRLDDDEVEATRVEAGQQGWVERVYEVVLVDVAGEVCATVSKTIYVATIDGHARRKASRERLKSSH